MKQSEIIKASVEALQEKLTDLEKAYTDMRMTHAVSPLENPVQLRERRRVIARIKTELTKRQVQ
ncbi:MAG TPA: 50S ribosomal protein L29 [Flavobacteriaceae bacterium]|nr:50S ribosomal protein L29 [Flavobacteriaceae bacterium]